MNFFLMGKLIEIFYFCEQFHFLKKISQILNEALNEEFPYILSQVLKCLIQLVKILKIENLNPHANQFLMNLSPIIRNKNSEV